MELGAKVKHLRAVEGAVRGLGRALTKAEVVRLMRDEQGQTISHAYLSQIEGGSRPHLTEATRDLLARFFKVHPGYLVSDPPGWETTVASPPLSDDERLKAWLLAQAEQTHHEPALAHLLLRLARQADPRRYIWLFDRVVDLPIEAAEQLLGQPMASGESTNGAPSTTASNARL